VGTSNIWSIWCNRPENKKKRILSPGLIGRKILRVENVVLDWEWVSLLKEARALGLTKEDIQGFFQAAKNKETFTLFDRIKEEPVSSDPSSTFGTPKTL
jgi:hypothetical protein